jgi:hypothetical protein
VATHDAVGQVKNEYRGAAQGKKALPTGCRGRIG